MKTIKAILIGAGSRGIRYATEMYESKGKFQIVAVAEPVESRREHIKEMFDIPDEMCFEYGEDLLKKGKIADIAIIATMDRQHYAHAMAAIELKYDLLLEKPIAPTPEECVKITQNAEKNGVKIVICTVLRYTPLFITVKSLIESGKIGDVISINHEENVGFWHQAHSFVRGNWRNEKQSSSMLLQKTCHDFDLLQWILGKKCRSVQSFGKLTYFKRENAPDNTPEFCNDGCRLGNTCPYNAVKCYLDDKDNEWFRTTSTHLFDPTDDDVLKAITETSYGKCVYKCDNNVVDHQTVNMLFDDDITVTFTMSAFSMNMSRRMHVMGTKGELYVSLDSEASIVHCDFETSERHEVEMIGGNDISSGHGGGDKGIIDTLYDYLTNQYNGNSVPTIKESCYNHLLTFAAERSRLEGKIVDIDNFTSSYDKYFM